MGRIAVIGGSEDYTGAPYFSAMASARLGADMVRIHHFLQIGRITLCPAVLTKKSLMSYANRKQRKSSRPTLRT